MGAAPSRFAAKVALVTGGNSGIGAGVAERLAQEGAKVVIGCRRVAAGEQVAANIRASGGEALVLPCDVTRPDAVEACVQSAAERFGFINVLVNAAGVGGELSAVSEVDERTWASIVDTNLGGAYRVSRAVLPFMARAGRGAIVHVGSIGSLEAVPRAAPYVASKTGLIGLTRSMALDYASRDIRVNCVCPAFIDTPLLREVLSQQPDPRKAQLSWMCLHPLGRFGTVQEVAAAVAFLASDEASFITGVTMPVDGGYMSGRMQGAPPELG